MIALAGKTCSGKTTILNELIKCGFNRLVTYTSRPMRPGEKQGIDYNFVSTDDFKQRIKEGFFAEYKSYQTEAGEWFYGVSLTDIETADNDTVAILTPAGIRDIKKNSDKEMLVIYINSNNEAIEKRLLKRGDNKQEARRRMDADYNDFRGFEMVADKIVNNHPGYNMDEVVKKVIQFIEQWRFNG